METEGRIIKGIGGLYTVLTDEMTRLECPAKGAFRHGGEIPCVGDRVCVSVGNGTILKSILPRNNILIRPPVSNVDTLFITFAAAEPEPNLLNVDKLTCVCEHLSVRPVIVITKTDILPAKADEIGKIYKKIGYSVFMISPECGAGEIRNFIKSECRNNVTCFAGASGVGKSTLLTRLFPNLKLETGEISPKISRGRNTTKKVELYPLNTLFGDNLGGFIADTPGFSMIDFLRFDFFDREVLPNLFTEFEPYIGACRYTRCTHVCEDDCSICKAVSDGIIPPSRHDSYVSIFNEMKNKHPWDKQKG